MAAPGILYVTMQPNTGLSTDQFHEWYNNEHGPTRMRIQSIFTNGLRYKAIDGQEPNFAAIYDVKSMSDLETEKYLALRANRSSRETDTIAQVAVSRHFYDLVHIKQIASFASPERLTDEEALGRVTVAVQISTKDIRGAEEEYQRWYIEEHAEMLSKVPGWLRSRLFRPSVIESGTAKPILFALHDYEKDNGLGGPKHNASMATPWRSDVFDKYVDSKQRQTWSLFYIFGPAPRDLLHLSKLPDSAAFATMDPKLVTTPGKDATRIESFITTTDSLHIPYCLEGNPSPTAPFIAFCNSLLTSYHMWDLFIRIIKHERPDLRILRYDTRGRHGISQPPRAATLEIVTEDLLALLDALRVPKLDVLVGVSMGGATALSFALEHPHRVRRLVACDFNVASSPANTQAWKERIAVAQDLGGGGGEVAMGGVGMQVLAAQTVSRWFHPQTMEKKVDIAQWMRDMVAGNDIEGFAHSCTALWDYDMRSRMKECRVPSLLVVGEVDGKGALVRAMDGFKSLLGECLGGSELKIVPNTGHLPMCEDPSGFWEVVKEFI